jgi:hypothetical protein
VGTPAFADANFREQLAKPVVATFTSSKTPQQMELCAADAIGESLLPIAFDDGNAGVVLFGFRGLMAAGTVWRVVSLIRTDNGTRIELRTRTSQPDENLAAALRNCG